MYVISLGLHLLVLQNQTDPMVVSFASYVTRVFREGASQSTLLSSTAILGLMILELLII